MSTPVNSANSSRLLSQTSGQPDPAAEEKGSKQKAEVRQRANAVAGGISTHGVINKAKMEGNAAQPPRVTSGPQFIPHSTAHNPAQTTAAPTSSAASSNAQPTPSQASMQASQSPVWTEIQTPDFRDPAGLRAIEQMVPSANREFVAKLIEQGAVKHVSAACRKTMMERLVSDRNVPVDDQRVTQAVLELLKAGVDVNGSVNGTPYIVCAAGSGNGLLVSMLAMKGANIDARSASGNTALMQLAQQKPDRNAELVATLVRDYKPNLNIVNGSKKSAMLLAAESGNANCLKTLLKLGVKLDQKDDQHQGLMIAAVRSKNIDTVQVALDAKVKIDQRDNKGETALFHAIGKGSADIVNLLIKNGADVNKRNEKGETPLAIACFVGCGDEVIRALLEAGADPGIKDNKGRNLLNRLGGEKQSRYEAIFKEFRGAKTNKA